MYSFTQPRFLPSLNTIVCEVTILFLEAFFESIFVLALTLSGGSMQVI